MTTRHLDALLGAFRQGDLDAAALAGGFRDTAARWPGLPERYTRVLGQLLMQVESSALFTEESCSFSRGDLADALGQWLDKARQAAPPPAA
ncbi:MAG: hypothetical protein RL456_2241 [Pseudomonadota bacterium]|jgi:hypothetical protein